MQNHHNRVFSSTKELKERQLTRRPHFDYRAKDVGKTAHFDVYSATILGQTGNQIAQAVLGRCEQDYQKLSQWFGVQIEHFNIIVAPLSENQDGSGGAYHHTCLSADLYCDVQINPSIKTDVTNALVVAEEVEVFEAAQSKGWDCGGSNGEGLSRVLAEVLYPKILDGYATAAEWLNSDRPDWVTRNNPTDVDPISNGCSVLFLYWLNSQLGYSWDKICQVAAPTLAETYRKLTNKNTPLSEFAGLLEKHFPVGRPSNLAKDNPFPL
ncbi:hypothetical protein HYR54_14965 [Candidatus Acetothermia bacterium]|nr:hypothetical protein [Candidatus Acetothermia bacterium]